MLDIIMTAPIKPVLQQRLVLRKGWGHQSSGHQITSVSETSWTGIVDTMDILDFLPSVEICFGGY
jgi:hypothetical protein